MSTRGALFAVTASLVLACSGATATLGTPDGGGAGGGSGSGSGSGGGSGGGGSGPGTGPCPASTPTAGSACGASLSGVACEYGDDVDLSCDALATCSNGSWTVTPPTGKSCPTPAASGACPSTYAAAEVAGGCSDSGLSCGYPQGRCECTVSTGGPPTVGVPKTQWFCDDPSAGCPTPRPRVGSACASSQTCDYGACTLSDGVTLACTGGTWQVSSTACAL